MTPITIMLATGDSPASRSFVQVVLDWSGVDSTWQMVLVVFGILAQCLFMGRWLVQWIATERRGESHIPVLFWWMSVAGSTLLLVYFLLRGEPVGVLGQMFGSTVYLRNLHLINRAAASRAPSPPA